LKEIVLNLVPAPNEALPRMVGPGAICNAARTVVPILDRNSHIMRRAAFEVGANRTVALAPAGRCDLNRQVLKLHNKRLDDAPVQSPEESLANEIHRHYWAPRSWASPRCSRSMTAPGATAPLR
jgi:hypothetical protein